MPKTPKIKHRAKVKISDSKYIYSEPWCKDGIHEFTETYGRDVHVRLPVPKKIGEVTTFTVKVEYLGERQYKQTYAQRVKAFAKSQERTKKWQEERAKLELEQQEKQLIQRRNRIMNQIELAFVKEGKEAVNFVTCDKCDGTAKYLGLAYENPGSQVIDPEQITGAVCDDHKEKYHQPFKTKVLIACERLEFFYDGLRQLYLKG